QLAAMRGIRERIQRTGGSMKRLVKGALLAAGTALAISAAPAMPAAAATSGSETLSGTVVFSGVLGTSTRTVISSVVLGQGAVSGRALLVRNPDGSCSFTQVPRHEVDMFAEIGTLSF